MPDEIMVSAILGNFDGNFENFSFLDHFLRFLVIFTVTSVTFRQIKKACDM